jgi:Raf kinase inhibitor-like YbhB/YbcL family protein
VKISSTAFAAGDGIPAQYTCEGRDRAPPLDFAEVPPAARSLVLIVDDPDAPDPAAPKMTWVHWVVYDLPPSTSGLPEGGALPAGARDGLNDWRRIGYGGPCPPMGRHRYYFKLYALDTTLAFAHPPTKQQLEQAMKGHVLAQAELVGTYLRRGGR